MTADNPPQFIYKDRSDGDTQFEKLDDEEEAFGLDDGSFVIVDSAGIFQSFVLFLVV